MQRLASLDRGHNKRRFSDEQVKSLEFMFESEARPESGLKQRLADEVGLQPRQVGIWFQNKRARSKTKLVEHKYDKLKAEFETLASSYDLLRREHKSLLLQLQKLKNLLEKEKGHGNTLTENSRNGISENKDTTESKERPTSNSTDYKDRNVVSLHMLHMEDVAMMNVQEEHTESSRNYWCKFESSFVEETYSTLPWWELWS